MRRQGSQELGPQRDGSGEQGGVHLNGLTLQVDDLFTLLRRVWHLRQRGLCGLKGVTSE